MNRAADNSLNLELDSHVDVFLIGPTFTSGSVEHISSLLDNLAALSFVGTSLPHVHEKTIYHVSLSRQLEKTVMTALMNEIEESELNMYFEQHHKKAGTGTALYILNLPFETDSNVRYAWSKYVSTSGFAWININNVFDNMASFIGPYFLSDNILPSPSSYVDRTGAFDSSSSYEELAVLIHRSMELLIPSILPELVDPQSTITSLPPKLHIRIFSICGQPLAKCQPDSLSISAAEALSATFSNEFVDTKYSSSLLRPSDSVSVMLSLTRALQKHAAPSQEYSGFFAATAWEDDSHANGWRNASVLSSDEFLHWMSMSPEVQSMLKADMAAVGEEGVVLPVFSVLLPDEWNVVLSPPTAKKQSRCGKYRGIHMESELATSLGNLAASMISCGEFKAPTAVHNTNTNNCAVVVLRRDDLPSLEPPRRGVGRIPPPLSTGLYRSHMPLRHGGGADSRGGGAAAEDRVRTPLMRDNTFEVYELGDMVAQIVWGLPPSYAYYSPSAQQVVKDFLWYDSLYNVKASAATVTSMYGAFRHTRILKRHMILEKVNNLVGRGAVALSRVVELMEASSPVLQNTLGREILQEETKGRRQEGVIGRETTPLVVREFNAEFAKLSADYSHMEFDLVQERLRSLEQHINRLEAMTSFGGGAGALVEGEVDAVFGRIECKTFEQYYGYGDDVVDSAGMIESGSVFDGYLPLILGLLLGAIAVLCLIRVNKGGAISIFNSKRWSGRRVVTR